MSIITFPSTLKAAKMSWGEKRNDLEFRSQFGAQAVELMGPQWTVSLEPPTLREADSGAWKSLLMRLRGRTNQLALWDFARPAPRGTMRGTMTLNAGAAQGATSLAIVAAGEAGKTLVEGDLLGLGSGATQQVVMVVADATANGSGVIAVTIEPPLRNAFSGGAAVTWDKPKALFRRSTSASNWDYAPGLLATGFGIALIEDWRA